jgi:putative NIF3 family GTP cyclohydrolase 1 type 2
MPTRSAKSLTTEEIMQIALDLSGVGGVPADSGVHVRGDTVRRVFATIDCDVADLLMARVLRCDTVLTHHPEGPAMLNGWKLIALQIEQMVECGVPVARAEAAIQRRMQSVELNSHARNYARVVQAAQLLNVSLLNVHLPCDVITRRLIAEKMAPFNLPESRATVAEVIAALQEFPEQKLAATEPKVRLGAVERLAGRVAVGMAGYTNGGVDVLRAYFDAGVGTVLMMHFPEADLKEAREQKLAGNLIVTGHMASDSIGINVYLDELERRGLEVVRTGGIIATR